MKKFQYIVVLLFVIVLGTGCSNDEKQENFLSETENEIENKEDGVIYEVYTGNWSNDGRTHDQILSEGGVELSCTITESNRLTGTLFAQQEMTERFAVVEDISGEIEQNELLFDYADDGWGNSGTLHMQFRNDSIYVEILNYCEADGGSDYGISGYYELIRENEAESREKELENTIDERSQYYRASAYYLEIVDYWENVREQVEQYLYRLLDPILKDFADRECHDITVQDADKQFVVDFYKYALVGMTLEWIRRDMKTDPKLMVERVSTMIHGDFRRALCRLSSGSLKIEE